MVRSEERVESRYPRPASVVAASLAQRLRLAGTPLPITLCYIPRTDRNVCVTPPDVTPAFLPVIPESTRRMFSIRGWSESSGRSQSSARSVSPLSSLIPQLRHPLRYFAFLLATRNSLPATTSPSPSRLTRPGPRETTHLSPFESMGQQLNKYIKRKRRAAYLKRKKARVKAAAKKK